MIKDNLYSWFMQTALNTLALCDRRFGNPVIDTTGETSPFDAIERCRPRGSVLRTYIINGWAVLGHEDVKTLIRDKRLSSLVFENRLVQQAIRASARTPVVPLMDLPSMLNMDAPDHTRLRKLVSQSFTNRFVQSLSPKIEHIVDELLQDVDSSATFDFMESIAKPLPAIVIAEMLGVPAEERHLFEQWSADLIGYTEILTPDVVHAAAKGDLAIRAYLADLVASKRSKPGQDLISAMIEAEEHGDTLDLDELLSTCTLLLVAGHETTTRLLGNCLLRLIQHPEQLEEVRQDLGLVSNAIEESLRLDPPVLALSRIVAEPFVYKGARFKKGQMILLSIAGANRDPEIHEQPEEFSVHRPACDHISFGHGIHLCLGMPLARLEAKIVLTKMLERFPSITLADSTVAYDSSPFFRGPEALNLNVGDCLTPRQAVASL